jgi:hypothetical protein
MANSRNRHGRPSTCALESVASAAKSSSSSAPKYRERMLGKVGALCAERNKPTSNRAEEVQDSWRSEVLNRPLQMDRRTRPIIRPASRSGKRWGGMLRAKAVADHSGNRRNGAGQPRVLLEEALPDRIETRTPLSAARDFSPALSSLWGDRKSRCRSAALSAKGLTGRALERARSPSGSTVTNPLDCTWPIYRLLLEFGQPWG